jgi:hypothetical protein
MNVPPRRVRRWGSTRKRALASVALTAGAWASSSCAPGGFRDETTISGVRIMASQAEPAYAKPGESVSLRVLAYDGRASRPEPMQVYWLPYICTDPPDDAYYACFQQFAARSGGVDGGADSGAAPGPGGLSGALGVALPSPDDPFQFTMPRDAVARHPPVNGTLVPYGLSIVFNVACAGHLEPLALDPSNDDPIQVPIGCFDSAGRQLGPDDYVIGFTRVYAYDTLRNANPVIDHVDVEGQPLDLVQGFTTPHCQGSNCARVHIGPVVPPDSWELNPELQDANGSTLHEEIWADFYSTFGQFNNSARLLYDAAKGSLGGPASTNNEFLPPDRPGDGWIWIVVHDSRGGASWVKVPVHVN